MSEYETQKRIMHQSNVVRDCLSSLYEWEKDIKSCSSSTQQNDCSISEVSSSKIVENHVNRTIAP